MRPIATCQPATSVPSTRSSTARCRRDASSCYCSAFAAAALGRATLGIYGVLSYAVSQRRPEIGIRMALGESARRVRARVMRQTLVLALIGVGIGLAASIVVSRLIASMLFGVGPTDGVTFVAMSALLLAVSGLAGYLPARWASKVDPMEALRD